MLNWLKENKIGAGILVTAIAAVIGLAVAAGCTLDDMIQVRPDIQFRELSGAPHSFPLSQADRYRDKALNEAIWIIKNYDDKVEGQRMFSAFISSVMNSGLGMLEQLPVVNAISAVPLGGTLMGGLFYMAGVFTKRPKHRVEQETEAKRADAAEALARTLQEKIDSFNKGMEVASKDQLNT